MVDPRNNPPGTVRAPGPFADWLGRSVEASDTITPELARRFAATLTPGLPPPGPGDLVPPGIHWCLAPAIAPMNEIGEDGHPKKGDFLPPVPLPRRMWAGGALWFQDPLRVGDTIERTTKIVGIDEKAGRTGRLVFVTMEHGLSTARGPAILERQDIVYREATSATPSASEGSSAAVPQAQHIRAMVADPVLLFRYSALTFNGHRIHYDYPYATGVEGYRGLVVHGPLQASLLLQFATGVFGKAPVGFKFKGVRPLIAGPLSLTADEGDGSLALQVWNTAGEATTVATAFAERKPDM